MNKKRKFCLVTLVGALAISAMGLGYATWKTDITANGNAAANGKWEVTVTDADLEVSSGAEATYDYSSYGLNNVCTSANISQVALQIGNTKASTASKIGTHTGTTINGWVWLVDTTRFDLNQLGSLQTEPRRLAMLSGVADGSIIRLNDSNTTPDGTKIPAMKGYYGGNKYLGSTKIVDITKENANNIVNSLIEESDALIKQLRPDTYQNYALILCLSDNTTNQPHNQFVIASMGNADGTVAEPVVTYTNEAIVYSDVAFHLPGAWAKYTLTVKNNGSVNANLADAVIELETEQEDQLVLDTPDLTNEVLVPGESCTLTFVVKVPSEYDSAELNAAGSLSIKLPYIQDTVETVPETGHIHE